MGSQRDSPFTGNPYGTYDGPRWDEDGWRDAFRERSEADGSRGVVINDELEGCSILGVGFNSTWEEIQSAFKALIKKNHPDRGGDTETAAKLIAAYDCLKERREPQKRTQPKGAAKTPTVAILAGPTFIEQSFEGGDALLEECF